MCARSWGPVGAFPLVPAPAEPGVPMIGLVLVVSTGTPFILGVAAGSPSSETLDKLLNGLSFFLQVGVVVTLPP